MKKGAAKKGQGNKKQKQKQEKTKEEKKPAKEEEENSDEEKIELPPAEDTSDDEEEGDDEGEEQLDDKEVADAGKAAARKTKANRLQQMAENEDKEPPGVVYLGHLPTGFYEPQMKIFFNQFGTVTRLRLSRSKKNARSKGYAFIEFEEESVAKIVADTMHKYLLFEKQLVCQLIPREKQHPGMFKGWKRGLKNMSHARRRKAAAAINDRPKVEVFGERVSQVTRRQVGRRNQKEKKLQKLLKGLDVNYNVRDAACQRPLRTVRRKKESKQAVNSSDNKKRKQLSADADTSQAAPKDKTAGAKRKVARTKA